MRCWPVLLFLPIGSACGGSDLAQPRGGALATVGQRRYQASAAGFGDCNVDHDGQNLCTHGAEWLMSHRQEVVDMYASYAAKTYAVSPDKPNALVALDHSAWLADGVTNEFWAAMPRDSLDFMWTTGVGNNAGFLNEGANSDTYNAATARYRHLYDITGLGILVDTSFGASQASDSWTGMAEAELEQRISEGVIAVNVTEPPDDYRGRLEGRDNLAPTCD